MVKARTYYIDDVEFKMIDCPTGHGSLRNRIIFEMTKGFSIGETPVTQDMWEKVMGWNPSRFKGSVKLPVESVTWYDCLVFCNKLSELEGFTPCFTLRNIEQYGNRISKANVEWNRNANGFRLPTDAEWEYCARAGTTLVYSGSNNIDEVAWYEGNSGGKTHEVKNKIANGWGLYDMTGNVWEWCMDVGYVWEWYMVQSRRPLKIFEDPVKWKESHCKRVFRGGSCLFSADLCGVSCSIEVDADLECPDKGFRLLRCEP